MAAQLFGDTLIDALAGTKASGTSALGEAVRPRFTQARADLAAAIPAFAPSRAEAHPSAPERRPAATGAPAVPPV